MEQETVQQVLASTSQRTREKIALASITRRAAKPKRLNLRMFDAALDEVTIRLRRPRCPRKKLSVRSPQGPESKSLSSL